MARKALEAETLTLLKCTEYLYVLFAIDDVISLDQEKDGFGAADTRQISLPVSPERLAAFKSTGD